MAAPSLRWTLLALALASSLQGGVSAGSCSRGDGNTCGPVTQDHVMLQTFSVRRAASVGDDCHTATLGERCYRAVNWARAVGVRMHPDWYPGLDASSSFEEFQQLLHDGGHGAGHDGPPEHAGCQRPCAAVPTSAPTPTPTANPTPTPTANPTPTPEPACHTAEPGERCFIDVRWAKHFGIRLHPDWYPNLTQASTLPEIQTVLHNKGHPTCSLPCQTTTSAGPPPTTQGPCQPLVDGEPCSTAVSWAKHFGVKLHPDWYPNLTSASSLTSFQALLHARGQGSCGRPCDDEGSTPAPSTTGLPSTTQASQPPASTTTSASTGVTTSGSPGVATRFMSWNVYYLHLADAGRVHGVAKGIARVAPEIASIQEMWAEKPLILKKLIEITGQAWAFAPGEETETVWDGDILYRSDIWRHVGSGLRKYGDRGLSWAALERIADGVGVLVYGAHPWYTYPDDRPILETMQMATDDMKARQKEHPYPVVFMGDMNAHYDLGSQELLRKGSLAAYGRSWCAPLTFQDSYAATHPDAPNPPSGNWPVKIDYVYFEEAPNNMGKVVDAQLWPNLPGGSDHYAVSGDIVLQHVSKRSVQNARSLC